MMKMYRILKEEFEYKGVSVIIASRECIQTAIEEEKIRKFK